MQLVDSQELGEGAVYPTWKLREMQQLGIQALIWLLNNELYIL